MRFFTSRILWKRRATLLTLAGSRLREKPVLHAGTGRIGRGVRAKGVVMGVGVRVVDAGDVMGGMVGRVKLSRRFVRRDRLRLILLRLRLWVGLRRAVSRRAMRTLCRARVKAKRLVKVLLGQMVAGGGAAAVDGGGDVALLARLTLRRLGLVRLLKI
jgi:hypothetical protein